jgi:hypothetical protein
MGSLLWALFIVQGEEGPCLGFFFLLGLLLLRGREGGGYKFMFFFSPSFDMWKEEGKRVSFFSKLFFHC